MVTGPGPRASRDAVTIPSSCCRSGACPSGRYHRVPAEGQGSRRLGDPVDLGFASRDRCSHVPVLVIDAESPECPGMSRSPSSRARGRSGRWSSPPMNGTGRGSASATREALRETHIHLVAASPRNFFIPVSARTGSGVDRLMTAVLQAYGAWNRRISTSKLNRWLEHLTRGARPPPTSQNPISLYSLSRRAQPPTFTCSRTRRKEPATLTSSLS